MRQTSCFSLTDSMMQSVDPMTTRRSLPMFNSSPLICNLVPPWFVPDIRWKLVMTGFCLFEIWIKRSKFARANADCANWVELDLKNRARFLTVTRTNHQIYGPNVIHGRLYHGWEFPSEIYVFCSPVPWSFPETPFYQVILVSQSKRATTSHHKLQFSRLQMQ